MESSVIPQIKKPSMVYGLGVASHLMPIEKVLAENKISLNMKRKDLQKLLEENDLFSGLNTETAILNNAEFKEKNVSGEDTHIEIMENESIHIKAGGNCKISINITPIRNSSEKYSEKSNHEETKSKPAGKIQGLNSSVIIVEAERNSDLGIKLIYDSDKNAEDDSDGKIESGNASLLKMLLGENAKVKLNEMFITSTDSFRRTNITLKGNKSAIYPSHSYFTYRSAKVDFKSEVTHYGENSESDMKVKGIINEKSQVITQGHVTIKPSAYNSNGYQQEDLILVGKESIARPIPNLEIGNNEVKCSHGATVSNIDEDTLFYLQSRGIKKHDAISLVLSSFLSPIMDLFSDEEKESYQSKLKKIIEESGEIEDLN